MDHPGRTFALALLALAAVVAAFRIGADWAERGFPMPRGRRPR